MVRERRIAEGCSDARASYCVVPRSSTPVRLALLPVAIMPARRRCGTPAPAAARGGRSGTAARRGVLSPGAAMAQRAKALRLRGRKRDTASRGGGEFPAPGRSATGHARTRPSRPCALAGTARTRGSRRRAPAELTGPRSSEPPSRRTAWRGRGSRRRREPDGSEGGPRPATSRPTVEQPGCRPSIVPRSIGRESVLTGPASGVLGCFARTPSKSRPEGDGPVSPERTGSTKGSKPC